MTYRVVLVLTLLLASTANGSVWRPVADKELTSALAYGIELANSYGAPVHFPYIRVFVVPEVIGECRGTLESCPDWRLYITISMGDLYEEPFLFQFPSSKGWEFLGWVETDEPQTVRFRIATTLPDANLDAEVRESWEQDIYEFSIGPNGPRISAVPSEGN